jgi:hypothetical protein
MKRVPIPGGRPVLLLLGLLLINFLLVLVTPYKAGEITTVVLMLFSFACGWIGSRFFNRWWLSYRTERNLHRAKEGLGLSSKKDNPS